MTHSKPSISRPLRGLTFLLALLGSAGPASATPIVSGQLQIQGSRLTIYSDALTTDAAQTINVGERARVRTCFGGPSVPCGSVLPGDPRVAGLVVEAELRGPELPQALELETVPGGAFVLPGFQQEGDYRLENIRLVEEATGVVVGLAEPSLAILQVRQILITAATVRALSLEELRSRGIAFSDQNFQAFNFAVGFAFGDEVVQIELPLVYTGNGVVAALDKPQVALDGLPANTRNIIARWQPPRIVPFRLKRAPTSGPAPAGIGRELEETLSFPLFGAIVIPGTVSYLNQFFEARLLVANGAPAGSDARLERIEGLLRLPTGNVLRMAATEPAVAGGGAVPVVAANGSHALAAGEEGSAAWTIEGLVAGTHALGIDVTGDLVRPGRDTLPLLSRLQAAVDVVDARFNLTFSHPDVVREGEAYSLFVTVTNLSRVSQNLITVDLAEQNISGAHRENSNDPLRRTIETLTPGQAETLEYRLVADLTGKVVATTFQASSSVGQGTIQLRTGVGELGIPLSPATLVLPRFSERLKTPYLPSDELYRAHSRFVGLAYSLAVAPAALVPPGLPRVVTSDVEQRAIDFGFAGLHTHLHEPLLEALESLTLEYLGNGHPLLEIDELRRLSDKGRLVGGELAALVRGEQEARSLGAEALFDHWTTTTTYAEPYVAAMVIPSGAQPLGLEVSGAYDGFAGTLRGAVGDADLSRGLPFGEVLELRLSPSLATTVPLALVGRVALDETLTVVVRNPGATTASGTLYLMVPEADGREDRRLELVLNVPAGGAVAIDVGAAIAAPVAVDAGTGAPASVSSYSEARVDRPPFRLIGAVQDFRLKEGFDPASGTWIRPNLYGNGLLYLFNRPPSKASGEDETSYHIRSSFEGLDASGDAASGVSDKTGTGAWLQLDERIVAVRYDSPLSALVDPSTLGPLLVHEHRLDASKLLDPWGESLDSSAPAPEIDAEILRVGGLVGGRVIRGTGEGVAGATVELIRPRGQVGESGLVTSLDLIGSMTTGANGEFYFDYVETPHWDLGVKSRFLLRAKIPAGADPLLEPATEEEVSSTIRLQNRLLRLNIALLGRGTIRGKVIYADTGEPVSQGSLRASSTLFQEDKLVELATDGSFTVPGVPVGPITLTARDLAKRVVYATVEVEAQGSDVDVVLQMPRYVPGLGTVNGTVVAAASGLPIADARVAVYSESKMVDQMQTDAFGRFSFSDVPEGQVSLQASQWEVSRIAVFSDLRLAAGETHEVTLRLPEGDSRAVSGLVLFHDPVTDTTIPIEGAVAFVEGPGVFAYTDATGRYRIEGLPLQGASETYVLRAIDFSRSLEGKVTLPPILDVSPDVVDAQTIVLEGQSLPAVGGIDGVVLDPLGRPIAGVPVDAIGDYPLTATVSKLDGSFSFKDVPVGGYRVTAHIGDGLEAGKVGYMGEISTAVVANGHRPFVSIRLVGAGTATVLTRTATATGILTPIFYKPTYYSVTEHRLRPRGQYFETSTDPNGELELELPVGPYELIAYNPFHGMKTINGTLSYAGQVVHHEIVFEDAATVAGQVVGVNGATPVPDAEVVLETQGLKPQTQRTDADGRFRFELVPPGRVVVTARGFAGGVERVGQTLGYVGTAGQVLDLVVAMKAQGTVRGEATELYNGLERPLRHAQYAIQEASFPFRRIPAAGQWLFTDAEGLFSVPHVYAGPVRVVVRDSLQVTRQTAVSGTITFDWQVIDVKVQLKTSVGSLALLLRDPATGGPVADAQIRLSNNDATVTDSDGMAFFDALPLASYSVSAFYAPTGQAGRLSGVLLSSPGQTVARTIYLNQRGEVRGTLWDDAIGGRTMPAGIVRLDGTTAAGHMTALTTTSSLAGQEGRFEMLGIPEGTFTLEAVAPRSPRKAYGTATLTATAPIADLDLVLEPIADRYFQLFEKRLAGVLPVSLAGKLFSLRLLQKQNGVAYDYSQLEPQSGSDRYLFPEVLVSRPGFLTSEELNGERRKATVNFQKDLLSNPPVSGAGTSADPYQVLLGAKGNVRVRAYDASGNAVAGANVTLSTTGGGTFPSVTGPDGSVTFVAVPAGNLAATATSLTDGGGGRVTGTLTYDDETVELRVELVTETLVSAEGVIYQPVPDDVFTGDLRQLVPAAGIYVTLKDAKNRSQVYETGEDGKYRFAALATGNYTLNAQSPNGDQLASRSGSLVGPAGFVNALPQLILDAGPPRLLSLTPPTGIEGVSRRAPVELVFSEPLAANCLPSNTNNPHACYSLKSATGVAAPGKWSWSPDAAGHPVVRFVPSADYDNFTVYSLVIRGGTTGVRDLLLRPLTTSGDVGSSFKTSDSVGPTVIGTTPDLSRPVEPGVALRLDFSEALVATPAELDGDFVGDAAELYWQHQEGSLLEWRRHPVSLFMTRSNFSLGVQPLQGLVLDGDTLARRLVVQGLEDSAGNATATYERIFRLYDEHAPVLDAVPDPSAGELGGGQLLQGNRYELLPQIAPGSLDEVSASLPQGDLDRVDYYFEDPTDPAHPVSPSYSSRISPYSFSFVASYVGDGVENRPFPVWVKAVDSSTNESNVVFVDLAVLPNSDPSVESVITSASLPVPGHFYAGTTVVVTSSGFYDLDGSSLATWVELWEEGAATPLVVTDPVEVNRPADGWFDAPSVTTQHVLPLTMPEGTRLFFRAWVKDSDAAEVSKDGVVFELEDDASPPVVDEISARLAGAAVTHLFLGEDFYLEVRARDLETAIQEITLSLDRTDLFPGTLQATKVAGTADLYRTAVLTVPVGLTAFEPVTVSVHLADYGGNETDETSVFHVGPARDPAAPQTRWESPWPGGLWPADYVSTVSADGAALLLRWYARDTNLDPDGNPIPGQLATVHYRGPVVDPGTGELAMDPNWTAGVEVPGSEDPAGALYEALWRVPNGVLAGEEVRFEVRLIDAAGTETITPVTLTAVPYRAVYEGATAAVGASEPLQAPEGTPDGPVFLLDGATLSVTPQSDGSVRSLPALYLFTGGSVVSGTTILNASVLTAPEITSYQSSIPYNPLELEITADLGVGYGSRIDVSKKGLLGSTTTRSSVLPGETGPALLAGGSHGGRGWFGNFVNFSSLTQPGTTFDGLRDPHLPGGGGASNSSSTSPASAGGTGGGVVRILAGSARVRIDGDVVADGGSPAGTITGGGGAGGTVRLLAGYLEGQGRFFARGGAGKTTATGGGGGGRIALTLGGLSPRVDLETQLDASGGLDSPTAPLRRAGAGTIFVGRVDLATGVAGPGVLYLENVNAPANAALTPLPSLATGSLFAATPIAPEDGVSPISAATLTLDAARLSGEVVGDDVLLTASGEAGPVDLGAFRVLAQRRVVDASAPGGARVAIDVAITPEAFGPIETALATATPVTYTGRSPLASIEADGAVRLLAEDRLLLGPGLLDDRRYITLRHGARAELWGEAPTVTFTATPPPGTPVLLGTSIQASWSVSDPIGMARTVEQRTFSTSVTTRNFTADEQVVSSTSTVTMTVPHTNPPASVDYTVDATDRAGRFTHGTATWPVLPNEAPAVELALANGSATPLAAGQLFYLNSHGTDREGLKSFTLVLTGPATANLNGTISAAPKLFDRTDFFTVSASADGSVPVVATFTLVDMSGASTTTTLTLPVASGLPVGTVSLAPGAPSRIEAGGTTTVVVQATDSDGLARIDLHVAGDVTQPEQSKTVTGTAVSSTFSIIAGASAVPQTVTVTATLVDKKNATWTTLPITFEIVADAGSPAVSIILDPEQSVYRPGDAVTITASATDDQSVASLELTFDGETTTSDGSAIVRAWTAPAVQAATDFVAEATAADAEGNPGQATRTLTVAPPPTDAPPTAEFTCPTNGAVLPSDYVVNLVAATSDDVGVTEVRFYLGDETTPFATVVPPSPTTSYTAETTLDLSALAEPTVRIRVEALDAGLQTASQEIVIDRVAATDLLADGQGSNDWASLSGQVVALRTGTLTLTSSTPISVAGLLVLDGATLVGPATTGAGGEQVLTVEASGPIYVGCGGAISATGRGYPAGTTYTGHSLPGASGGGSHLGVGGGPGGETFGSVTSPRESGGSGGLGSGGGAIRVLADRVQVDGAIRADGTPETRATAGGSVSVSTRVLAGRGALSAAGGLATSSTQGSGGGGAVALELAELEPGSTLLETLTAQGGATTLAGGAGTVFVRGPSAIYGDLVVDSGAASGSPQTILPSLGAGAAAAGSADATLVVTRSKPTPAYFVGHWVEVYDGASGALEGRWQIAAIGADGLTLTLAPNAGETISVSPGDRWQGVYLFDDVTLAGDHKLVSADPIRVFGEERVLGKSELGAIDAERIVVATGATLTHAATTATVPRSLRIDAGELVVESGGTIDVSGRGYPNATSYPSHALAAGSASGSHLGEGGGGNPPAQTFGSVYFPQENGGGGSVGLGGGVVRIAADRVQIDGTLRADGAIYPQSTGQAGAGGSVWITAATLAGQGSISVRGGAGTSTGAGGGAIAVEYGLAEAGSTVLGNLRAEGGASTTNGGAGTVFVRQTGATYGALRIDNGAVAGNRRTVLPSLGSGLAGAGSLGATLVTARSTAIPAYFVGHWIEIYGPSGSLEGRWPIAAIDAGGFTVTLGANGASAPTVDVGDRWQGVYVVDSLTVGGEVQLVSADPIRVNGEQRITGKVETSAIQADRLVVASGATLTHPMTTATLPQSLRIEVGELVVEAGATIDVSGRGYPVATTYPSHFLPATNASGSHLGEGGSVSSPAQTFGSLYFPQENGSGAPSSGIGGGVVRILAGRAQVDGSIKAEGAFSSQAGSFGGGGGSVWITSGTLAGDGSISVRGGSGSSSGGGGGAVAVDYGEVEAGSTLLDSLLVEGGATTTSGGAGTIYLRRSDATYGRLVVDNKAVLGNKRTVLPALGGGVAILGSGSGKLATDRTSLVAPYFVGHWIEITDGATGALKGRWRIASFSLDGPALTFALESNASGLANPKAGDRWQGVYLFDELTVGAPSLLFSLDPIRVIGREQVDGQVIARSLSAGELIVAAGGKVAHPAPGATSESLLLEAGDLVVEAGGAIDASGLGYAAKTTYPLHGVVVTGGGSHLGEGGYAASGTAGETFGSVYFPTESGAGGDDTLGSAAGSPGGGAVRIVADHLELQGVIRADGLASSASRAGAGGSVWIAASSVAGVGSISAGGGASGRESGGGGAIAIELGSLAVGSTVLEHATAAGGATGSAAGGAGTVYVKGPTSLYGSLTLDNQSATGYRRTLLPSLGSGTAGVGSAGSVLATGRPTAIPAYFVGHWVEVTNGATGAVEGLWRIASIASDGVTATLATNAGEPLTVDEGDNWQGVYLFDAITLAGELQLESGDPIRASEERLRGKLQAREIHAEKLVVESGSLLRHPAATATTSQSLTIEADELVVEAGGAIDVSGLGYPTMTTYPFHVVAVGGGGSHLGQGGTVTGGTPGETFGSVYFPLEMGGGGDRTIGSSAGSPGGGVVHITSGRLEVDGLIRADGGTGAGRGGAGGSVWIEAGSLAGGGTISAVGGNSGATSQSAGGGAVSIAYGSLELATTLLDNVSARGGTTGSVTGGAGTVYLKGPGAALGSLVVDNGTNASNRKTILPSLGRGIVLAGSGGTTLVTDRDAEAPAYFLGSWVEIEAPDRHVRGIWRIASISGTTMTLEPKPNQPVEIVAGDRWRGVYRFDSVTVSAGAILESVDSMIQLVPDLFTGGPGEKLTGGIYGNDEDPTWFPSQVAIAAGSVAGSYRIEVRPGAVSDPDGISEVRLTSGGRWLSEPWTAEGASFLWPGRPGQRLHLVATDAHDRFRRSGWLELPALPEVGWPTSLVLAKGTTPFAVAGDAGHLALGERSTWIYDHQPQPLAEIAPAGPDDEVLALALSGDDLMIATAGRIDLVRISTETLREVRVEGLTVVDAALVAGSGELVVLLSGDAGLYLATLPISSGVLSAPSEPIVGLDAARLVVSGAGVHLFGSEQDGTAIVASWPLPSFGQAPAGDPEVVEIPGGWRAVGAWANGAVLLEAAAVRLLEHGVAGWQEVGRLDLDVEPVAAAVSGESLVVVAAGQVLVYDVFDPAAPVLVGRHPGSSWRAVEPLAGGEVLLWAPRLAAPPLRWDPLGAVPGPGFVTVIDGLPEVP